MASGSKKIEGLEDLKSAVDTTLTLITRLQACVPAKESKNTEINALELAHDTAFLIRAHATKLSLLVINKPFTASAITKILHELGAGPLPGLASAVELCCAGRYTKAMGEEVLYRAKQVFSGLETLVKAVPLNGKILDKESLLPVTGNLWKGCDMVVELKKMGIAGLMVKKAEEYKALLLDALEELQDWEKGEGGNWDLSDGLGEDDDEDMRDLNKKFEPMFSGDGNDGIPKDDPDKIRPRLEESLRRLKLVVLMYTAVVKRRLKTLPKLPQSELSAGREKEDGELGTVKRLDEAMRLLKRIPDQADELAGAFYDLDPEEIDNRINLCFGTGFKTTQLLAKNWEGRDDEFSAWASKFQLGIKKTQ